MEIITDGGGLERHFSEEFGKWYDLYPCKIHGFHIDFDHETNTDY